MRIQPDEAIYLKINNKVPGLGLNLDVTKLDLTYKQRYNTHLPDAYERLILDVVNGDKRLFIRNDELDAAWALFTPILKVLWTFNSLSPTAPCVCSHLHRPRHQRAGWGFGCTPAKVGRHLAAQKHPFYAWNGYVCSCLVPMEEPARCMVAPTSAVVDKTCGAVLTLHCRWHGVCVPSLCASCSRSATAGAFRCAGD